MRILLTSLLVLTVFLSANLSASPLDDARKAGQIIETADGYVRAKEGSAANISTLATDVNERRQAAYAKIAKKNGLTVKQVGEASYKKRMEK